MKETTLCPECSISAKRGVREHDARIESLGESIINKPGHRARKYRAKRDSGQSHKVVQILTPANPASQSASSKVSQQRNISQSAIKKFQKKILEFYVEFGRDLPWRKTTDPYAILVSEVMLQQTQVDRVIDFYERWIHKWPSVHDLALANMRDVLTMWMGLGYNNRAVNLHKACQTIMKKYNGDVIAGVIDYKNVPGIGPYTSAAVQIFARNTDIVTVDTNIRRILICEFSRLGINEKTSDKELWEIAQKCLPKGKSREWHNALMDYGATFLTSRKTGVRPVTKQSRFEGSDRQIRAHVLKYLLGKNGSAFTFSKLHSVAKNVQKNIDEKRLKEILEKLKREKIILGVKEGYSLCE